MKLEVVVLDRALEWLIPKIGTKNETVINEETNESIDGVQALCIWCLRLRYNLVEHQKDGCDPFNYSAWYGHKYQASCKLYKVISRMSKQFIVEGGTTPDYSHRTAKDVSVWTYKRVLGPDKFIPIKVYVEKLWQMVCNAFPEFITVEENLEDIDKILEFEMYTKELAAVVEAM